MPPFGVCLINFVATYTSYLGRLPFFVITVVEAAYLMVSEKLILGVYTFYWCKKTVLINALCTARISHQRVDSSNFVLTILIASHKVLMHFDFL